MTVITAYGLTQVHDQNNDTNIIAETPYDVDNSQATLDSHFNMLEALLQGKMLPMQLPSTQEAAPAPIPSQLVTKKTIHTDHATIESDSICSVEVGGDAKGNYYIRSLKVYSPTITDAVDKAIAGLKDAHAKLQLTEGI